ncbi:uncharacterized protein LOC127835391 [Dreissena polymorpha]|uniref:uncharacterized protein LOC127835391 n=1 Tax=Dreissena polymorpha TaxID=45954 RepID=UPI0022640FD9|nr:uncharacterized protein LOC127835391 [Dreissena polymorpha]
MPDLYRRSPGYRLADGEVPIRDDLLTEGWYDIGRASSLGFQADLISGFCGSIYPMVLKDALTTTENNLLAAGNELTKTMHVNGQASVTGIQVKIRTCEDRTHVYFKKAPIAFAAYCVDTGRSSHAAGLSSEKWAKVRQDLMFKDEHDVIMGTLIRKPYVDFNCLVFDERHPYFCAAGSCYGDYYRNDGVHFTINWYVAGKHCKRYGPYQRSLLYKTHMTEMQVAHECGQQTAGFEIQCSIEWSESLFGKRATPIFSESVYIGLYSWITTLTLDEGAFLIPWMTDTPMGCQTKVDNYNGDHNCTIEWDLETGGVCPTPKTTIDHDLCGMLANSSTVDTYSYNDETNRKYAKHFGWTNGIEASGAWFMKNNTYGLKVLLERDEVPDTNKIFKASFTAARTDHSIWNGYKMPDLKLIFVDEEKATTQSRLVLTWDSGPLLEKINEWNETTILMLDTIGEFLLLKGNMYIVEIQIKTETCGLSGGNVCVCAITFRNGNEIYTVDICNSVKREGFIYVGEREDGKLDLLYSFRYDITPFRNHYVVLTNGLAIVIDKHHRSRSLQMTLINAGQIKPFDDFAGIAAFKFKQYRHRSGVFKSTSLGFIENWRVAASDSLLNTSNHHSVNFDETYFKCHCPSDTELRKGYDIKDSSTGVEEAAGSSTIHVNTFTGTLKCSRDSECTIAHAGKTMWKPIVMPAFVEVSNVTLTYQDGIVCSFNPVPGKRHKVEWVSGNNGEISLKNHSLSSDLTVFQYDILSSLFASSGDTCKLDKIRCAITVYEKNGVTVSGPSYFSKAFDLNKDLIGRLPSFCVIRGYCFSEYDANPKKPDFFCYPHIDPYHWIKNLSLPRAPGDICVRGSSECDTVPGGAFCSYETGTCQCYPTHSSSGTECSPTSCWYDLMCSSYLPGGSGNIVCLNNICACAATADISPNGCKTKELGSKCTDSSDCGPIKDAICSEQEPRTCSCGNHYQDIAGHCYPTGLGDTCEDDTICKYVPHSACYALAGADEYTCHCDFGYSPDEYGECHENGDLNIPDPYYGSSSSWCYDDDECTSKSMWWTVCDRTAYWRCVRRTCDANDTEAHASCMSSLLRCNKQSGFCEPAMCSARDTRYCVLENTECNTERGYCDCIDGYTMWNGDCSPVLGRACEITEDCHSKKGRYECVQNQCVCNQDMWVAENGLCVSYVDKHCNTSNPCGKESNTTCNTAGLCECQPGFVVRGSQCVSAYLSGCNNDLDCAAIAGLDCGYWAYYDGMWFSNWGNAEYSGICVCKPGYAVQNLACTKVLGSNCDNLKACGNSSHWSYSYHYFSGWGPWYIKHYYSHYHSAFFCDVDNQCECSTGYEKNADGTDCIRVYQSSCINDNDCHGAMFKCDRSYGSYGQCECANNYTAVTSIPNGNYYYYYYSWYFREEIVCKPYIGLSCSRYSCSVPGASCDDQNVCQCYRGYEKNGACVNFIGSECETDTPCQHVANAKCNASSRVCSCIDGYYDNGMDECSSVNGRTCSVDIDCVQDGMICDSGFCKCASDRLLVNGRCTAETGTTCHNNFPALPDIVRRSPSYILSERELAIRDDTLSEGWYNIGHYMLSTQSSIPVGGCGTRWPMYMTSPVTSLADGSEVTRNVRLVSRSGIPDDFPVRIRKCGAEHQVYVQQATVVFAALCVDTGISSNTGRNSTGRWAKLIQELDFVSGIPEITFICQVLDDEHEFYPCRNCADGYYYINDDYYYTVNWYVNEKLCTSLGPFQRHDLRQSHLTEQMLRDRCQQATLGFSVQCSYAWSMTPFGHHSTPVTSNKEVTGLPANFLSISLNGSSQIFVSPTPLGCDAWVSTDPYGLTCEIEWHLKRTHSDSCPPITTTSDHTMCGARLLGLTQTGLNHYGSWSQFYQQLRAGGRWHPYGGNLLKIHHGRLVSIDTHQIGERYTEQYCPTTTVRNSIWQNYTLPEQKIIIGEDNSTHAVCSVRWSKDDKQPMLTKKKGKQSWSIPIDVVGDFLLLRSLAYPVEVQIKTEPCESSDTVCVCALTFQDGNKVYTVGICDGISTEGFLWAAADEERTLRYTESGSIRVLNGMVESVTKDYSLHTLLIEISESGSMEDFTMLDGLCAFEDNTFRASTGGLMLSSDGFLESWSIPTSGPSLLTPSVAYTKYAYTETLYSCGCPLDSEGLYDASNANIEYSGVTKCSKQDAYNVTHDGKPWTGTIVPDFAIENVTLSFQFVKTSGGKNIYKRMAFCHFDGFNGYLYDIAWYAGEQLLHKKSRQSLTTNDFNAIDMETIMSAYNKGSHGVCAINKLWRCAVTVLSTKGDALMPASFSEPFEFITITDRFITMPRGGEVDFHFNMNLPLLCFDGQPCNLEIKVYDESDDYTCQDSTLAVKSNRTCGDFVSGIKSIRYIDNFEKERSMRLTTKNNNKYSLRDVFSLTLEIESEGAVDSFWNNCYLTEQVHVFVRDIDTYWKGVYCYTNNDPRIMTFDGQYYSMQLSGEFTLYRHKYYKLEVQIQTQPCWPGGWATCTCGVTVRAGRDVYTVTHCENMHIIEWIDLSDDVLEVYIEPGYMHKFYLPHGTIVDATYYISPWWSTMSVYVYPSPNEMGQVEGLCGTFNGNWKDDFLHSDGSTTESPDNDWGFWWWWRWGGNPDVFSQSWSVPDERSLLNLDYVKTLEPWQEAERMCVCPLIVNKREKWCNKNEDKTCVEYIYKKRGKRIQKILRDERSVDEFNYREESDIKERLLKLRTSRKESSASRVKRETSKPDPAAFEAAYNQSKAECEEYLKENCDSDLANVVSPRNKKQASSCAEDKMFDVNAAGPEESTCRNMKASAMMVVEKDVVFQERNPEKAEMFTKSCPDACHNNGNCSNGTCLCNEHFDPESNCKLDLRNAPDIIEVTGGGNCNPRDKACHYIRFTTKHGCSNTTVCSISFKQYKTDGTSTDSMVTTVPANCPNNFDAYCPTTVQSRKRREVDDGNPVIAESYNVSLSNNNETFSEPNTVTVLDTTCVEIVEGKAQLTPQYCLVDNVCYGNYTDIDDCHTCDPAVKKFSWTLKTGTCDIGGTCYQAGNISTTNCAMECNPTADKYSWTQRTDVCSVEGQCHDDGDNKSSPEECLYCDVRVNQFSWTQREGYCLIENACYENGTSSTLPCQYCHVNKSDGAWTLEDGYCFIAGECFPHEAVNPTDDCHYCDVSMDTQKWQRNTNISECQEQEDNDDNTVGVAIGAAIGVSVAIAAALAGGFFLHKHLQAKKAANVLHARATGSLFEGPKKTVFKFRVEPAPSALIQNLTLNELDLQGRRAASPRPANTEHYHEDLSSPC